jgi:hypothetical protein
MDERLKKMLGIGQSMFGRQPEFGARTGIAQNLPGGKSPFSPQMQDTMNAAAADYGTKQNSQQTYQLAQQDMAFDTNWRSTDGRIWRNERNPTRSRSNGHGWGYRP